MTDKGGFRHHKHVYWLVLITWPPTSTLANEARHHQPHTRGQWTVDGREGQKPKVEIKQQQVQGPGELGEGRKVVELRLTPKTLGCLTSDPARTNLGTGNLEIEWTTSKKASAASRLLQRELLPQHRGPVSICPLLSSFCWTLWSMNHATNFTCQRTVRVEE